MRFRPFRNLMWVGILLLAVGTAAQPAASAGPSPAEVFEALYAQVTQAVEAGELTAEVGEQARDLWVSYRKAVIESNAELEILKLEASTSEGSEQAAALDRLVEATAERERLLIGHVRRLESLSGLSAKGVAAAATPTAEAEASPASPPPDGQGEAASEGDEAGKGGGKGTKKNRLEIDFVPEDLVNTPQWMG